MSIAAVSDPSHRSSLARRALVIVGDGGVGRGLALALSLLGLDVRVADNALVGLAIARTFHPELVLCDLDLHEIASSFRRDRELCDAHLIALSSGLSPEAAQRAVEAGFARHLATPVRLDALIDAIAAAAGDRRQLLS